MTKRVLIVDDEFEISYVIQRVFEDFAGWQTVAANSSLEGLQKAKTEVFDAIVLDLSMPDIDGFQFIEELQAYPETKDIPVVLLTAKIILDEPRRFEELPIAGIIAKPFDPVAVWQQVAKILKWDE